MRTTPRVLTVLLLSALYAPLGLAQSEAPASPAEEAPIPPKLPNLPSEESAPTVNIRRDEKTGDVIEEYRTNGRLQMVKVTPARGRPYQIIDTNGDGKLDSHDYEGRVRPVYWTLFEWN
ncbi:DUF2782 domain-containing protein [uncultured Aquimonas sp.]|uniref:DUF2782 domain-containing protein n=1 Tax=uncultured Aquimonas sp. TaxID=385483 RepID=UPI00086D335E|nr:DUF2782 domain-containing protein [uncultured Aquimonas sp.]ODU41303.1 MAG: hypothetical protein ABS96_32205 [Xanthomonadaceae bacterium SCN 69-123]